MSINSGTTTKVSSVQPGPIAPEQNLAKRAFMHGVRSLVIGALICAVILLLRNGLVLGFGGLAALLVCISLVFYGLGLLFKDALNRRTEKSSRWLADLALIVLLLNFPIGWLCAKFTFEHFSRYTITVVNASIWPLDSVRIYSDYDRISANEENPFPDQRFERIDPGQKEKVRWNARDEEGVNLDARWSSQTLSLSVTGYTLWAFPKDYTVRFENDGTVTVNGTKRNVLPNP